VRLTAWMCEKWASCPSISTYTALISNSFILLSETFRS
jgi:hypothetical protein